MNVAEAPTAEMPKAVHLPDFSTKARFVRSVAQRTYHPKPPPVHECVSPSVALSSSMTWSPIVSLRGPKAGVLHSSEDIVNVTRPRGALTDNVSESAQQPAWFVAALP